MEPVGMTNAWKLNGRYGLDASADADYAIHDLGELLALRILGGSGAPATSSPTQNEDDNEDRY